MKTWETTYSADLCSGRSVDEVTLGTREAAPCGDNAKYWITYINENGIYSIQYCEKHKNLFNYFDRISKAEGWGGREIFRSKSELIAYLILKA